jgi:dihydrofolate synthase/folylpolyglutamate synthase
VSDAGEAVYQEMLSRLGEASPEPRLGATRRAAELLGDPHRAYPVIHVTGTNGKSSTSRMIESLLRAHDLRTGLFTSPHLTRINERIVVDGEPISDATLAANWADIQPVLGIVDAELLSAGQLPLTFFEVLAILAFATFADAPVDVAVIEVGMGGEWDATNIADGQVAVITPISLDHTARLGSTVQEIARTKSGIIKPVSTVVTASQPPSALAELERAAEMTESILSVQGTHFAVQKTVLAVGGQAVSIRGIAGRYDDVFLPLFGDHQAQNAAVAVAAVESFIGGGDLALGPDNVAEGLGTASSPGRLQVIGHDPSVLIDAAHNPAGAESLSEALLSYFSFTSVTLVLGIVADKDAAGIIRALDSVVDRVIVTQSHSERATPAAELGALAVELLGPDRVTVEPVLSEAVDLARRIASTDPTGAVVVTGSITLLGEVIGQAESQGWAV